MTESAGNGYSSEMEISETPWMNRAGFDVTPYQYSRADGAAVAQPLFQVDDGGSIPTSALHLKVNPIGLPIARQLNALWHSALPEFPPQAGGLPYHDAFVGEYQEHWYAVAIWTGPVNRDLNDGSTYELRRFAIAPCAPRNTASRMLAVMRRLIRASRPEITRLVSYQLLDRHEGTIYKANGWEPAFSARATGGTNRREADVTAPRPRTRATRCAGRSPREPRPARGRVVAAVGEGGGREVRVDAVHAPLTPGAVSPGPLVHVGEHGPQLRRPAVLPYLPPRRTVLWTFCG